MSGPSVFLRAPDPRAVGAAAGAPFPQIPALTLDDRFVMIGLFYWIKVTQPYFYTIGILKN